MALWQANLVANALRDNEKNYTVELVEIVSEGDKTLDIPLAQVGGKGLFLKELEIALLEGDIDLAVHSMKDVTVEMPEGLHIPIVFPREDPRDALVSNRFSSLQDMPEGSRIGTCSLRRQCQIKAGFPHLQMINLRGNVNTRLSKLDSNEYDGIILAVAGLKRLDMEHRIKQVLTPELCLPAIGQGIVGVECRIDDAEMNALLAPHNDSNAWVQVECERAANKHLGGGCHVPVAIYSELENDNLTLWALVGEVDGSKLLRSMDSAPSHQAVELGIRVAEDLVSQGAAEILNSVYQSA